MGKTPVGPPPATELLYNVASARNPSTEAAVEAKAWENSPGTLQVGEANSKLFGFVHLILESRTCRPLQPQAESESLHRWRCAVGNMIMCDTFVYGPLSCTVPVVFAAHGQPPTCTFPPGEI